MFQHRQMDKIKPIEIANGYQTQEEKNEIFRRKVNEIIKELNEQRNN